MKLDLTAEWAEFERAWAAFWEVNGRVARDRLAGHAIPRDLLMRRHDLYTRAFATQDRLQAALREQMQALKNGLP